MKNLILTGSEFICKLDILAQITCSIPELGLK